MDLPNRKETFSNGRHQTIPLHPSMQSKSGQDRIPTLRRIQPSGSQAGRIRQSRLLLNIDRPETQFPPDTDIYAPMVYQKAHDLLWQKVADGTFIKDDQPCYYIYELTMNGRTQTGIAACASIDDYENQIIKKHENTRADKEADRIRHVDVCSAQTGPIFLAYRSDHKINRIVEEVKQEEPLYDFVSDDGVRHRMFAMRQEEQIRQVRQQFAAMQAVYIADGHHRAASAVKVGLQRRQAHPDYTGEEAFNYFLSVLFPDDQLMIMDYNRVVKDLAGMTAAELLEKVSGIFDTKKVSKEERRPQKKVIFRCIWTETGICARCARLISQMIRSKVWMYRCLGICCWSLCLASMIRKQTSALTL